MASRRQPSGAAIFARRAAWAFAAYSTWGRSHAAEARGSSDGSSLQCGLEVEGMDWTQIREEMWSALDPEATDGLSSRRLEDLQEGKTCLPGALAAAAMLSLRRSGEDLTSGTSDEDHALRRGASGDPRHFQSPLADILSSGFPVFGTLARLAEESEKASPFDAASDAAKMGHTIAWAPRWTQSSPSAPACNSHRVRSFKAELSFYLEDETSVMPTMPMVEYLESPWSSMCTLSKAMALLALATAAAPQATTESRRTDLRLLIDSAEELLREIADEAGDGETLLLLGRAWPAWSLLHRLQRVLTRPRSMQPAEPAAVDEDITSDDA